MKNYLFILISLSAGISAFSQNVGLGQTERLYNDLSVAELDTTRALIMAELAEAYRGVRPDSTFYYGQKALDLSRRIGFPKGEVKALLAINIYFTHTGNLPKSLEAGLKALQIAEQHNLRTDQAFALIRLGNVYLSRINYREALNYYQKANKLVADGSHPFFYAVTFWLSADVYEKMNMPDSALYMAQIGYKKGIELNNGSIIAGALRVLGNIYIQKGDYQLGLKYHWASIAMTKQSPNTLLADSYVDLANFYRSHGRNDSAIYYATKADEIAKFRSDKQTELKAAILLAEAYEAIEPTEALRHLKIANTIRDSIYSYEKLQALNALRFEDKERQNELVVASLNYKNRIRQYALLAGIVGLLIIAMILWRHNRHKQKANIALNNKTNELEEALSELKSTQSQLVQREKMASMGELTAGIAHEIQNPLNFVNNFSEVNKELADELEQEIDKGNYSDAKALARDIKDNEQKINHHGKRADAIVKGMLQHSRSSSGVKEPTDINALCDEYLRLSYHGLRAKDKSFNAKFETEFDSLLPKINVVPQDIGRVILNLINNAFYAVTEKSKQSIEGYEPTVTVSTKKEGDKILISVKDNGNGIPQKVLDKIFQPFFTTKPTGQGTGLGLSLSYDIVKAHGGELRVETKEGEGTEFIVMVPY